MGYRLIELKYCAVQYHAWGCEMRFADGSLWPSIPHPELPHYHVIAHRCGYGDDLMAYCREHEVCHGLVAEWFYDGPSRVLHALARGAPHEHWDDIAEEIATMTLQRFVRANERPIVGDVDWDALKRRALHVLDEAPPVLVKVDDVRVRLRTDRVREIADKLHPDDRAFLRGVAFHLDAVAAA